MATLHSRTRQHRRRAGSADRFRSPRGSTAARSGCLSAESRRVQGSRPSQVHRCLCLCPSGMRMGGLRNLAVLWIRWARVPAGSRSCPGRCARGTASRHGQCPRPGFAVAAPCCQGNHFSVSCGRRTSAARIILERPMTVTLGSPGHAHGPASTCHSDQPTCK